MNEPRERRSLAEVFRQQMRKTDNDMPVAFIAVLHELDQRQRLVEDDLDENARLFNNMTDTLNSVCDQQNKLPGRVQSALRGALNDALTFIRQESHDGAESGAKPTTRAIDALIRASKGYDDHKRRLTYLAAIGLPVVFCAAMGLGMLFGNFGIRALPAQWQWTCKVVGGFHHAQDDGQTFCIIRKD